MTARGLALVGLLLALAGPARAQLNEGFNNFSALSGAGWVMVNNGVPGTPSWFSGNTGVFTAQAGPEGSYVAANFVAGASGAVDQWLITPELPLHPGHHVTFYTRTHGSGFGDVLRVRVGVGSSTAVENFETVVLTVGPGGAPYPDAAWGAFAVDLPDVPGLTSGRIAFQYSAASPSVANYAGIDSVLIVSATDVDSDNDGWFDGVDNCPTVANADQADGDADGVGNVCDNCVQRANPRPSPAFFAANPWAGATGGQRDDDHDGFGNICDAQFVVPSQLVGSGSLTQLRASMGHNRAASNCGTIHTEPCGRYDLDEINTLIGSGDLTQFRSLVGKAPGPKCPICPLP